MVVIFNLLTRLAWLGISIRYQWQPHFILWLYVLPFPLQHICGLLSVACYEFYCLGSWSVWVVWCCCGPSGSDYNALGPNMIPSLRDVLPPSTISPIYFFIILMSSYTLVASMVGGLLQCCSCEHLLSVTVACLLLNMPVWYASSCLSVAHCLTYAIY